MKAARATAASKSISVLSKADLGLHERRAPPGTGGVFCCAARSSGNDDGMANAAASSPHSDASHRKAERFLTVAWMAAIAGVVVQALVIAVRALAGAATTPAAALAEIAQGVAWSSIVCVAIAVGTLSSKAHPPVAGVIGLIAAPAAWAAAKGVQKAVQALAQLQQDQFTPLFWVICLWKGIEYAALGIGLALLVGTPNARAGSYITLGGLLGLLGGCMSVALNVANAILTETGAVPIPRIASLVAGEVFFAAACALVIYMAQGVARRMIGIKAN